MTRLNSYDPSIYFRQCEGNRWLFRWRFEYWDEKNPKIGGWYPATRVEDMASTQTKNNLARAVIEGKNFLTKEVKVFAEVLGEDFINFEHLAIQIYREGQMINHVYGMRIQARTSTISCLDNGEVKYEPRSLTEDYRYPEWTGL